MCQVTTCPTTWAFASSFLKNFPSEWRVAFEKLESQMRPVTNLSVSRAREDYERQVPFRASLEDSPAFALTKVFATSNCISDQSDPDTFLFTRCDWNRSVGRGDRMHGRVFLVISLTQGRYSILDSIACCRRGVHRDQKISHHANRVSCGRRHPIHRGQ